MFDKKDISWIFSYPMYILFISLFRLDTLIIGKFTTIIFAVLTTVIIHPIFLIPSQMSCDMRIAIQYSGINITIVKLWACRIRQCVF